ncbi:hypothetical protein CgunFtcFv8_015434 [Champsocephalus gunnari]|uniref:Uncharacterized protein n=1 Tax=Champsocephalus gunnari TaxID=52237 RepID=A0AAN8C5N5_CHAGU|nr:hypothetical protein CgunFtcFv8_015434 [Champsocephalus gunnari]
MEVCTSVAPVGPRVMEERTKTSLKWARGSGWVQGAFTQEEPSFSLGALGSTRSEVTILLRKQHNRDNNTAGATT